MYTGSLKIVIVSKAMSNDTQLLITPTAWTQVGETVISKQEDYNPSQQDYRVTVTFFEEDNKPLFPGKWFK